MRLDSARHRQFEILRLTEDLSDSFSAQVTKDLTFNRDMLRRSIVGEYEQIFKYSGLNHDVFLDWFETIFDTHCPGFVAKNLRHVVDLREYRNYSPIPDRVFEGSDDWNNLQEALALSMQGQGAAVFSSQEEINEQARLLQWYKDEKARRDFLRSERGAPVDLLLVPFDDAPYYLAPEAQPPHGVAEDDETAARDASFQEAEDKAREKITIFPVSSRDVRAEAFKVNVGELIEKVVENEDSIELFGIHWKMTNRGGFVSYLRGNPDSESMIKPTVGKTADKNGLVQLTYKFKKEKGNFIELKLEEFKLKTSPWTEHPHKLQYLGRKILQGTRNDCFQHFQRDQIIRFFDSPGMTPKGVKRLALFGIHA